jgi:hypothetical protein
MTIERPLALSCFPVPEFDFSIGAPGNDLLSARNERDAANMIRVAAEGAQGAIILWGWP